MLEGEPYRIRGLIVHGASLLTSWPQTPVWRETLSELDFLVCIDRQLTADAAYADIVLPATTMFEIDSYMVYGPIFRLREKLIEPVGEARNDYLIMAELARRLGYGELYPQTEEELIRYALEGSGFTLEEVREAGGWVKLPAPMMEYRKWEKGGLRADGKPGFDTPTGKFEIRSTMLEEYGYEPLPKYTEPAEGPAGARPTWPATSRWSSTPARARTPTSAPSTTAIEGLVEGQPRADGGAQRRRTPRRAGIETGDLVEVRTPRGAVPLPRPGHRRTSCRAPSSATWAAARRSGPKAWREWNVNELTDLGNYDEISGFPVYKALLCEVVKAGGRPPRRRRRSAAKRSAGLRSQPRSSRRRGREARAADLPGQQRHHARSADAVREAMLPFLDRAQRQPVEHPRRRARRPGGGGDGPAAGGAADRRPARGGSSSPAAARRPTTWRSRASPSPRRDAAATSSPARSSTRRCWQTCRVPGADRASG